MAVGNGGRSLQDYIHTALFKLASEYLNISPNFGIPSCNGTLGCAITPESTGNCAHSPSCYII